MGARRGVGAGAAALAFLGVGLGLGCNLVLGIKDLSGSGLAGGSGGARSSTSASSGGGTTSTGTTSSTSGTTASGTTASSTTTSGTTASSTTGTTSSSGGTGGAASICDGGTPPCVGPLSCQGLAETCGPGGNESCCASPLVPAGVFKRSYDGVSFLDPTNPAQISALQMDRFLITVGRFRSFVSAVVAGWSPAAGSGTHTHLNGGAGLNGGTETGWDATWTSNLATTEAAWDTNLECDLTHGTWTAIPESNEDQPVNCVTWFEAYAFCIWDGGFLPTEAEWNYAAAGGGDTQGQRVYPWSTPPSSATIDATYAVYGGATILNVGSESPTGDGRWGQADLAGTVQEWILDWDAAYVNPCVDCALLTPTGPASRVLRSGSWYSMATYLVASGRNDNPPATRTSFNGARCARAP